MFIVRSYDPLWEEQQIVGHGTKEECEAYIHRANIIAQNRKELREKLDNFCNQYRQDNPIPMPNRVRKEVPSWPSGLAQKDITEQMRLERKLVTDYNKELEDEIDIINRDWRNAFTEAKNKWFRDNIIDPTIEHDPIVPLEYSIVESTPLFVEN